MECLLLSQVSYEAEYKRIEISMRIVLAWMIRVFINVNDEYSARTATL